MPSNHDCGRLPTIGCGGFRSSNGCAIYAHKKKFRITANSKHNLPIAPNLLDLRFSETAAPNQVWVADITYILTDEGGSILRHSNICNLIPSEFAIQCYATAA